MEVKDANLVFTHKLKPLDLNNLVFLVIHHMKAAYATPQQVHQWHLDKGWWGNGYNEYVTKAGITYICRGDHEGAHTAGYNDNGYGIGVEGNYQVEEEMPEAQFNALVERIRYHKSRLNKDIKVIGHGDLSNTSCPGRYFPMIRVHQETLSPIEPDYKFEGIDKLAKLGHLNTPDAWKRKLNEPLPVWAGMLVMSRLAEVLEGLKEEVKDIKNKGGNNYGKH